MAQLHEIPSDEMDLGEGDHDDADRCIAIRQFVSDAENPGRQRGGYESEPHHGNTVTKQSGQHHFTKYRRGKITIQSRSTMCQKHAEPSR